MKWITLFALLFSNSCLAQDAAFEQARRNGELAREGFERCQRFVEGWGRLCDEKTGLVPRNSKEQVWEPKDSAADNYPFMVLSTWFTDRPAFEGRMLDILRAEEKLTSRVDRLVDAWSFPKQAFRDERVDMERVMFGSAEYTKDGLLPLTEWLGDSPWRVRMIGITDDMWKHAFVQTPYGALASANVEVQGDQLQALSRIYWMTGDRKYLEWGVRLGDWWLLGNRHPTRQQRKLRLRDHGCEIVSGLVELYVALRSEMPAKHAEYRPHIHAMLDRILEVGRNEHGMLYDEIDPVAGKPLGPGLADTWGYNLNAHYTVYLLDRKEEYRQATIKALSSLNQHYRNYHWEGGSSDSADGHADSIESALNLYNREPVASAAEWIDHDIQVMWSKQKTDGVIEGWHGDGNFARTTIMYCLWKTQGMSVRPWRNDVAVGAVRDWDAVKVVVRAGKPWTGRLMFDSPRHRTHLRMPLDYPRINQFAEWFTVEAGRKYEVDGKVLEGEALLRGLEMTLEAGAERRLVIKDAGARK